MRQKTKTEYEIEVKPLTVVLKERRFKLLGHVIRAEAEDPLKEVTFNRDTMEIKTIGWKRVGRPKTHWIHTVMREAWNEIRQAHPEEIQEYDDMYMQKEIIKQTAENRRYPFHTKPKSTYAQRKAQSRRNRERRNNQRLRREAVAEAVRREIRALKQRRKDLKGKMIKAQVRAEAIEAAQKAHAACLKSKGRRASRESSSSSHEVTAYYHAEDAAKKVLRAAYPKVEKAPARKKRFVPPADEAEIEKERRKNIARNHDVLVGLGLA